MDSIQDAFVRWTLANTRRQTLAATLGGCVASAFLLLCSGSVTASEVTQNLVLKEGWNSVHIEIELLESSPDTLFETDAAVPLSLVSRDPATLANYFEPSASVQKPFVEIPHPELFNLTTHFTIEAWVKVLAFTTHSQAVLTKGDCAWGLARYQEAEKLTFRTFNGIALGDLNSQTDFKPNAWHHVAMEVQVNCQLHGFR